MEGVDYSTARPRPWVLNSEGKRFALRYAGPGSSGKHMTFNEVKTLTAAGLWIGTLAEGAARDALLGRSKGMDHARAAHAMAMAAGMPRDGVIYFAVDFDASKSDLAACVPYFDGAAAAIGFSRVGCYGGYRTIDWAANSGHAAHYFQTYAWSAGKVHPRTDVLQYKNGVKIDGGAVDLCRSLTDHFGAWRPATETTGEAPVPDAPPGEVFDWDYAAMIGATATNVDGLAATLEGSARDIEIGW